MVKGDVQNRKKQKEAQALKDKKELAAIVRGASWKSAFELVSEKRENVSQEGLLSVERGEGKGNWFHGFGVVLHKRVAT